MNSPKVVAEYIGCLSILEEDTALIYSTLSVRVESPALIKSLLLSISQDSLKHSELLSEIASSISGSRAKRGDCAKKLGKVWSTVSDCLNEVKKKEVGPHDFSMLLSVLDGLESSLGEEYYNFVQTKTLQLMVNEIDRLYDVSLKRFNQVFEGIIKDEERHREILGNIKDMIGDGSTEQGKTQEVKYQNPDSWIGTLPPATYDSV
jgi:hypothetical protein